MGSLSVNDYRFLAWRDWLSINPVESVFFSDLSDVIINRDSFEIQGHLNADLMLSHQSKRIGDTSYFAKNYERVFGKIPRQIAGE